MSTDTGFQIDGVDLNNIFMFATVSGASTSTTNTGFTSNLGTYVGKDLSQIFCEYKQGSKRTETNKYKLSNGTDFADFFQNKDAPLTINVYVTVTNTSFTYDGNSKSPSVTVRTNADGTGVITQSGNYTINNGSKTNSGSYTLSITSNNALYVVTGTNSFSWTINKANMYVTVSPTTFYYNATAQSPTVTVKNAAGTTITETNNYTITGTTASTDEADYTLTVTAVATSQYVISGDSSFNWYIKKPFKITTTAGSYSTTLGSSFYVVYFNAGTTDAGSFSIEFLDGKTTNIDYIVVGAGGGSASSSITGNYFGSYTLYYGSGGGGGRVIKKSTNGRSDMTITVGIGGTANSSVNGGDSSITGSCITGTTDEGVTNTKITAKGGTTATVSKGGTSGNNNAGGNSSTGDRSAHGGGGGGHNGAGGNATSNGTANYGGTPGNGIFHTLGTPTDKVYTPMLGMGGSGGGLWKSFDKYYGNTGGISAQSNGVTADARGWGGTFFAPNSSTTSSNNAYNGHNGIVMMCIFF